MLRIGLRGLLARRTRLVLTTLAVALGVALVAGTYVFTDTIDRSFERLFTAAQQGTDVAITPREVIASRDDEPVARLPETLLDRVRAADGVAAAEGMVEGIAAAYGPDGEPLATSAAPSFVFSLSPRPAFDAALEIAEGRRPRGPGEALLDAGTAGDRRVGVGDAITVQGVRGRERLRVVGLSRLAGVDSIGGLVSVAVTLPEAQRLLGREGRLSGIQVAAREGVSPADLTRRLRPVVGATAEVRTATDEAAAQAERLREDLSFLSTALLAFAGIAVFVGAFLIFNTFAITVAQRTREIALLRTLGASRRQVLRSVLAEGALLGALGAVVGLGLGLLAAEGLRALFVAVGLDLPSTGTVVAPRTVVVSLAVGLVVTVAAAVAPALRATRVAPVEALAAAAAPSRRRPSRRATAAGGAVAALGVALTCAGLFAAGDEATALPLMGGGSLLVFLGVALLSPHLVPPLARVTGWPIARLGGLPGRLARENALRQPGRTAVTAAALMVGVALVAFASIFAAGARESIARAVQGDLRAQVVVQNEDGFSPFPPGALRRAAAVDGVAAATGVRFATVALGERDDQAVSGVDPSAFPRAFAVDAGAFARLAAPDTALVSEERAEEEGLRAGDALVLTTAGGERVRLRIAALFADDSRLTAPVVVSLQTMERRLGEERDAFGLVVLEEGVEPVAARRAIEAALRGPFPVARALTAEEFVEDQAGQVDQLLGLILALLSLSVIVALVGIVNTLVLSVRERTRELGLLRAVGAGRRQIRAAIRWEAVLTALIGAVLGLGVGVLLATLFTRPLDDFVLVLPVAQLAALLVVAALAGVAAAAWPARRAARLDVLEALAYE
jgi:putative ABC transport system permease protein